MTYSEKLRDPRWQKKRLKVMEHAKFRCQICGAKDQTLHVHHSYYTRGKEPWQYPDGALICICHECHRKLHPEKFVEPSPEPEAFSLPPGSAKNLFGSIFASLDRVDKK